MKKLVFILWLLFLTYSLNAQVLVKSSTPADGSVGVPTSTVVSVTFNTAIDTSVRFHEGDFLLTNIFSRVGNISPDSISFSADRHTFTINVPLKTNKDYFLLLYGIKSSDGSGMNSPYLIRFTTATSFQGQTVSGTVIPDPSASNNIAIFLLDSNNSVEGEPNLKYCAIPNADGSFSIPNVNPAGYLPIAVTDFEGDGRLNFDEGNDLLVFGKQFMLGNTEITDLLLDFKDLIVVDSSPSNGAISVPRDANVFVNFNYPLNENVKFRDMNYVITNLYQDLDNAPADSVHIKEDMKSLEFETDLKPNQDYFILIWGLFHNRYKRMIEPFLTRFTTASNFSGVTVSGNISAKNGCCNPENSVLFLVSDLNNDGPSKFNYCGIADSMGHFEIPYVKPGTYFPIAVKDINNNGMIEIGDGIDVIGFGDSIVVANSDIGGVNLTIGFLDPYDFSKALTFADSVISSNTDWSHYHLKLVKGEGIINTHYPTMWKFYYYDSLNDRSGRIKIGYLDEDVDLQGGERGYDNLKNLDDYVHNAANLNKFLNAVFSSNNLSPFWDYPDLPPYKKEAEVELGQLSKLEFGDMTPDSNGIYWGAIFTVNNNSNMHIWNPPEKIIRFLGNYQTGDLIVINKVKNENPALPQNFSLAQNYPNPFGGKASADKPVTTIRFSIPKAVNVRLTVYDILGRKVAELANKEMTPGSYNISFNAANLPSGIYFYRLNAGNYTMTKKMILLK